MMTPVLRPTWAEFWRPAKQRGAPAWSRLLLAVSLVVTAGLALLLLSGLLNNQLANLSWWRAALPLNVIVCISIACAMLTINRCLECVLQASTLDHIAGRRDWRAAAYLNTVVVLGIAAGVAAGLQLAAMLPGLDARGMAAEGKGQVRFLVFLAVLVVANCIAERLHVRQRAMQQRVLESRLRLMQAQLAPQFLFTTLAGVQDLIDHEPLRAKQMLECFTDHLRASLAQLRDAESSLAAELETVGNYLQLLRIRTAEQLSFTIEASDQARGASVPTLLLQPLVELAIPGGSALGAGDANVSLSAAVQEARLEIALVVHGHGGLSGDAQRAAALKTMHARLAARYGAEAFLRMDAVPRGLNISLNLPYAIAPCPVP